MAVLISHKIDFKTKTVTKDNFRMRKGEITPEIITFIIIHTPDSRVPKYMKQRLMELKGEINNSTENNSGKLINSTIPIIVGETNASFLIMSRTNREINKEIKDLNNTIK